MSESNQMQRRRSLPSTRLGLTIEETLLLAFNLSMIDAIAEEAYQGNISVENAMRLSSTIPVNAARLFLGERLNEGKPDEIDMNPDNEAFVLGADAFATLLDQISEQVPNGQ